MKTISYKDRIELQKQLKSSHLDTSITDSNIISQLSRILSRHPPSSEIDKIFHQYTLDLINTLRIGDNDDACTIAKSALLYVLSIYSGTGKNIWKQPSSIRHYVTSLAIKKIRNISSILKANESEGLLDKEREQAESLLCSLATEPKVSDFELIKHANNFCKLYKDKSQIQLITRYIDHITLLVNVLKKPEYNGEKKDWARGALGYIQLDEDVISDNLGLIGLLDDMYIANVAVHLLNPELAPWNELIASLKKKWPVLNELVFCYQDIDYRLGEFASINSALACLPLIKKDQLKTILVLPFSGLTPHIIAISTAFGAISTLAKKIKNITSFKIGEKVNVDNDAIAIFDGINEINGEKLIRLNQPKNNRKNCNEFITSMIPINEIARLSLASNNAKVTGSINMHRENTKKSISAIESIFHLLFPLQFINLTSKIWLISPITQMKDLVTNMSIHGQHIIDIFPIGNIKSDGKLQLWNEKFENSECLLTVINDLDLAVEILDEQKSINNDIVIVNLSGSNRRRFGAIESLFDLNTNYLLITEEKEEELLLFLEEQALDLWEWDSKDVRSLCTSTLKLSDVDKHPFHNNDNRALRKISLQHSHFVINNSTLTELHRSIQSLSKIIIEEEINRELDNLCNTFFREFIKLCRIPTKTSNDYLCEVKELLITIEDSLNHNLFISSEQRKVVKRILQLFNTNINNIAQSNPKIPKIKELINKHKNIKIVVPNYHYSSIEDLFKEQFISWGDIKNTTENILLIPYWPGRQKAWELMSSGGFNKLIFILYSFEEEWYYSFVNRRDTLKYNRTKNSRRENMFTQSLKWPTPRPRKKYHKTTQNDDPLDTNAQRRKERLISFSYPNNEELSKAILVGFHGDSHAFLSLNYEARVVTDLFQETANSENQSIITIPANNLSTNDILIFLKGSNIDAIRILADLNLPEGRRDQAKLWQTELRRFVESQQISISNLKARLQLSGCKKHKATIKSWLENENIIAPRDAHRGTLDAICNVTNSQELKDNLEICQNAITEVRGEHLKAAHNLAEKVLNKLEKKQLSEIDLDNPLEIFDDFIVAKIQFIEKEIQKVPHSKLNRLLEDY